MAEAPPAQPLRIAILGAGALGSAYGARLALAGQAVTFVTRGAHLAALRETGLTLHAADGTHTLPSQPATDDPATVEPVHLVLLTAKAYHLPALLPAMAPLLGPETAVLPLLNGVGIVERLQQALGTGPVLGGLSYMAAALEAPGVVRVRGAAETLVFGEWAGGTSPRAERIAATLAAGVDTRLSADVRAEVWVKYMRVCATQGLCCVTRQPVGPVVRDAGLRRVYVGVLQEVEALARAQGVALAPDVVDHVLGLADKIAPDNQPSMLQDLVRGRPLEVDSLLGNAVRMGQAWAVPTPLLRYMHAALKPHAGGAAQPERGGA